MPPMKLIAVLLVLSSAVMALGVASYSGLLTWRHVDSPDTDLSRLKVGIEQGRFLVTDYLDFGADTPARKVSFLGIEFAVRHVIDPPGSVMVRMQRGVFVSYRALLFVLLAYPVVALLRFSRRRIRASLLALSSVVALVSGMQWAMSYTTPVQELTDRPFCRMHREVLSDLRSGPPVAGATLAKLPSKGWRRVRDVGEERTFTAGVASGVLLARLDSKLSGGERGPTTNSKSAAFVLHAVPGLQVLSRHTRGRSPIVLLLVVRLRHGSPSTKVESLPSLFGP